MPNWTQIKSELVNSVLQNKPNKTSVVTLIAISVVIILGLFYTGQCIRDVGEVVQQTIEENPILNAVATVTDKIPNPVRNLIKKKKKDNTAAIDQSQEASSEETVDVRKRTFKTDIHLDAGIYTDVVPTEQKFLIPKPSIGLSLFSYGPSKKENIFRFVRLGVGGWPNSGLDVTVAPLMYNLGHKIPIITNTYVYPHVGYNATNNRFAAGLGMSLSF